MFEEAQSEGVIVNFGEDAIIARQVDAQLMRDAMWSGLSLLCAFVMLRIGAGSTFLTLAGIFQILVCFPSHHIPECTSSTPNNYPKPGGGYRSVDQPAKMADVMTNSACILLMFMFMWIDVANSDAVTRTTTVLGVVQIFLLAKK
jgi:hypothetical protein